MRNVLTIFACSIAILGTSCLYAHTPLEEVPDLNSFNRTVHDWEDHRSFYADNPIDIVDVHLHPGSYDKLGPKGKEFVKSVFPVNLPDFIKVPLLRFFSSFQLNPYGAFIGIKNECRKASANNCILFATYAPETWGIEPNEDLLGYLDDSRNSVNGETFFYGLASINVTDWNEAKTEQLANLEAALAHPKVVGIKLAFAHTLTPFDATDYYAIYDVAREFDKPVYHHVGTSPLRKVSDFEDDELDYVLRTFDPVYLEDALKQYPDVTFVLGHAGNDANQEGYGKINEAFALAEKYRNVYIEISALGSTRNDPDGQLMDGIFLRAKRANIVDRIIYGSDGPGSPGNIKSYKDLILQSLERVGYSFDDAQKVMADNARSIFNIPHGGSERSQ